MKLAEAKAQFIHSWGVLATQWGINRTMAQIHALLMVTHDPISADEVMEKLDISRGNVNMNIRELITWGLVEKVLIPGERREFFSAEKDIWIVARQVIKERKKRELEPLLNILDQLSNVEGDKKDKEIKTFNDTISGINKFSRQADRTLNVLIKADENWFFGSFMKFFK